MESRERNSINYNNSPISNQDSSPRLNTRRTDQTLNHPHQVNNNFHGFKLQREILASPPPPPPPSTTDRPPAVRYRECLKNHAASMGSHVLDGCGEFMPAGAGDHETLETLKCAACECHRSFHRREVEGESQSSHHTHYIAPPPCAAAAVQPPPPPVITQQPLHHHRPMRPIMMAFGGANGAAAESSSEDFNIFQTITGVQLMTQTSKKRFRTKFTQEQKDKMLEFAERIEWKIQKQDDEDVLRFCNEVGLKKQVFKVWMHNNKQTGKKK